MKHAVDLVQLYTRHAQRFDRARTKSLMERPYLETVTALAPRPELRRRVPKDPSYTARVLDLGCGSGEPLARFFIERGYHVTGVDMATTMLDMCRERFPTMTWHQADMRTLDLPERFDIVIAWDSFFHLSSDDQRGMFATFRRHASPRGVLLFTSGVTEGEEVGGDLFGDQLYHASLDTSEYAALLDRHGYDVVLHRVQDPSCGDHTVWVAQLRGDIVRAG